MDVNFLVVVSGNLEERSLQRISFSGFPDVVGLVGTFIHNPRESRGTENVVVTQEVTTLEPVLLQDTATLRTIATITTFILIGVVHPSGVVDDQMFAGGRSGVVVTVSDAEGILFTIGSAQSGTVGGGVVLVGTDVGQSHVVDIEVFNEILGPNGGPVGFLGFTLGENAGDE